MWQDEIVEEIRKYRDEHAAHFGYDIKRIYLDLKEKEKKNPNKKISLAPKIYLKPTGTLSR